MHYNQAGLPAPRAKHSQPHRSRVSVQPNDRSQTVTARSPLTRRARVEERTAVANRCRQIEHGSQGLVSLSVKVHVQDLLARMRSHHRKRVSIPAGTASASKHVRHRSAKVRTATYGSTQEGCGARQCNDIKAVRGAANAAPTTAHSCDSSVMSSATAERLASKSLQDQRPWQLCGESPRRFSKFLRGCEPTVHRSGILKRCGEFSFRVRTHSNQSHPMVLFGPP